MRLKTHFLAILLTMFAHTCDAQSAGPDQLICLHTNTTMQATGMGRWSQPGANPSALLISDTSSGSTAVSGFDIRGRYLLIWQSSSGVDSVTITVDTAITPTVRLIDTYWNLCSNVMDTFYATVVGGGALPVYYWYDHGVLTGGNTPLFNTLLAPGRDTFSVMVISSATCATTDTARDYIIKYNQAPPVPLLTVKGDCAGQDTLVLQASDAYSIKWYMGDSLVLDAKFPQEIIATQMVLSTGNMIERIGPTKAMEDSAGYLYAADYYNDVIVRFPPHSTDTTIGTVVAGLVSVGSGALYLNGAIDIFVTPGGEIYVLDTGHARVQKYPAHSTAFTAGVTVAGGNGDGNALNQFSGAQSIYVDNTGNIYVADGNNNRILKFPAGSTSATNGIVVAGGNGSGTANNQFHQPKGVYVDAAGNIFVSDFYNHRVQKFPPNGTSATNGTTVAGGNGIGRAANQTSYPWGLTGDAAGNLYVAEFGNHRVQKFPDGSTSATNGITVAGDANNVTYIMKTTGVSLDKDGAVIVADWGNYNVQRWRADRVDTTYLPTSPGVYSTVSTSTDLGCITTSDSVTLTACPESVVWPGDADANGRVDNIDLLPLGLGYDSTGTSRSVQSIVWQPDTVADWSHRLGGYFPYTDYKHADCDGNGRINAMDTDAIIQNFSLTHQKTFATASPRAGVPMLNVYRSRDTLQAGDILNIIFTMGDSVLQANDIYGLAFTYNFDPTIVDSTFTSMSFGSSWIGNSDKIAISKTLNSIGQIKAAVTRIDHQARSGYGPIARANFRITTDNISGKYSSYYSNIGYISDIVAIDNQGNQIQINEGADTSQVGYEPSGIPEVADANITLYPNPATGKVSITADDMITAVSITDIAGLDVHLGAVKNSKSITVDLPAAMADGIYFVHIKTTHASGIAKLSVIR